MLKQPTLILLICIQIMTSTLFSLEISTLYPEKTKYVEGAIEFTNSRRENREKIYNILKKRAEKKETFLNKLYPKSYLILDFLFFGAGGSPIAVHEVGHNAVYNYLNAITHSIGTGSNTDASLLEVYLFSASNGGAFATATLPINTLTNYNRTLIAGAGTNAQFIVKKRLQRDAIKHNNNSDIAHLETLGIDLLTLNYISLDPSSSDGNDFNSYLSNLNAQGHSISIDNLRSEIKTSMLLDHLPNIFNVTKESTALGLDINLRSYLKKLSIKNITFYYPQITTFLMPEAITRHIELFIKSDLFFKQQQLYSISWEYPTLGSTQANELTIGFYPTINKHSLSIRLANTFKTTATYHYLNIMNNYKLTEKLYLTAKAFIGDSTTFSQIREALSKTPIFSVGFNYKF